MDALPSYPVGSISIKNLNKRLVLELIRFTSGGISRAELARRIDITRSSVSTIVDNLLEKGLVHETKSGPTTGGRRPILLEIDPKRGYVVGVDMGATHVTLAVADFQAQILHSIDLPFEVAQGPTKCLAIIEKQVEILLNEARISLDRVLAIGVGVPGPVLVEEGCVSAPPIMPGWDGYPIRAHLHNLWKCPVSLNNDAELGALGEWAYGAGQMKHHLIYIKVGSGIGAGLILNGQIFHGANGMAGEIGHLTIQENGPKCACGNLGCLEALAGGTAIAKKAREAVQSGSRTILANIDRAHELSAHDIYQAARVGDQVAQQIVREAGAILGIAIAGIINLTNPNIVVIGGEVSQMGDLLLEPIRRVVRERSLLQAALSAPITSAVLGQRAESLGAIVQAIDTAIHDLTEEKFSEEGGGVKPSMSDKDFRNTTNPSAGAASRKLKSAAAGNILSVSSRGEN